MPQKLFTSKGYTIQLWMLIPSLSYNPEVNEQNFANLSKPTKEHRWKGFTALWHSYNENNPGSHGQVCNFDHVFANRSNKDEIYPLTAQEVVDAQIVNATLKHCFKHNHVFDKDFDLRVVRIVIPKPLQKRAVLWFHHYLQHPGHTRLEEAMQARMY